MSHKWVDLAERAGWTLFQAGFAVEAVNLLDLPAYAAIPIAGALAAIKAHYAQKFGNGTGATVPAKMEASF